MRSKNFINVPNPSSRAMALGLTQFVVGMSTTDRNKNVSEEQSAAGACDLQLHRHL
jgi:hypothetical protein